MKSGIDDAVFYPLLMKIGLGEHFFALFKAARLVAIQRVTAGVHSRWRTFREVKRYPLVPRWPSATVESVTFPDKK